MKQEGDLSDEWLARQYGSHGSGRYCTASVCLNGHVASADTEKHRAAFSKFCSVCGAQVITACPGCNQPIRGYYIPPSVSAVGGIFKSLASYCYNCGKPYPWTTARLEAAKSLADDLEEMSTEDRAKLKTALDDVVAGGPKAEAGAHRIKKMLGKVSPAVGQAVRKFAVDVASETVKKILMGS
jgi:hypothetical protein